MERVSSWWNQLLIRSKLRTVNVMFSLAAVFGAIGIFEVAQTGVLRNCEREHIKLTVLLKYMSDECYARAGEGDFDACVDLIDRRSDDDFEMGMRQVVEQVREQPLAVYGRTILPERLAFRAMGFGEAFALCDKDIEECTAALELLERMKTSRETLLALRPEWYELLDGLLSNSAEFAPLVRSAAVTTTVLMIVLMLLIAGTAFWFGERVADSVVKPIAVLMESGIRPFAGGDVRVRLETDRRDEIADLYASFNKAVEQVGVVAQGATEAVRQGASIADNIVGLCEEIRSGAEQQAEQARQVVQSTEGMLSTVQHNAKCAAETADAAVQNSETARSGQDVVGQTIAKMQRIADVVENSAAKVSSLDEHGAAIGNIVQVIQGIAEQTNLLALNATIEAARAGEHGRGFGVVASEVKALASSTRDATGRVAEVIERVHTETAAAAATIRDGRSEIDEGLALSEKAGGSLDEILGSGVDMRQRVEQIAASNDAQSAVAQHISEAIGGVSKVSEETAVSLAGIQSNLGDLGASLDGLKSQVAFFRV